MGCCNSTPKKARPEEEKKAPVKDIIPVEVPKEIVVDVPKEITQSRLSKLRELRDGAYGFDRCTAVDGVSTPLLTNGICHRIVRDESCFFYNDTLQYEIHVHCQFPPTSSFSPSTDAIVKQVERGWREVSVVVYPLETVYFGSGEMDICKTDVIAQPLSKAYYSGLEILTKEAEQEEQNVRKYATESNDEEYTLRKCVENDTPYVDLTFLPSERMFSRPIVDGRVIVPTELRRPRECGIDAKSIDTIRGEIIPHSIDCGLLGDTWLMCAAAIIAESPGLVKEIFAQTRPEEQAIGAYRVAVNKHGWWQTVLLDDFFPTVNGVVCYARTLDDPAELWVSLLQKAYAKLHGSYASITGGDTLRALQDFSGAPARRFDAEWAAAANGGSAARKAFAERLARHADAGHAIVLNTAATCDKGACAAAGLRCGFAYSVEAVRRFADSGVTMLKVRDPWGYDGERAIKMDVLPEVREACAKEDDEEEEKKGSFWIEWAQAMQLFVGGGVVLRRNDEAVYDYRVQGKFASDCPSVVFAVHAMEQVDVCISLSQKDKRGIEIGADDALFVPIMISVSAGDDNKQRVDLNSTTDPENPSEDYTFVVGRDVAMRYTFKPSDKPYFIIPRIRRDDTVKGNYKDFVMGIQSSTPLEGKLDIQFTKIEETNRVFANKVTFVAEETEEVSCVFQKKAPGAVAVTEEGARFFEAQNTSTDAKREIDESKFIAPKEDLPSSENNSLKNGEARNLVNEKTDGDAEELVKENTDKYPEELANEKPNEYPEEVVQEKTNEYPKEVVEENPNEYPVEVVEEKPNEYPVELVNEKPNEYAEKVNQVVDALDTKSQSNRSPSYPTVENK